MATRSKPLPYTPLHFYAARTVSIISCIIVIGIVGFFCRSLWADKYKIPWTLVIVLLAALANLAVILLTSLLSCCGRISALLNILLGVPVLIVWLVGISLLTWNIYGALGHSCSITNWGNDRGVMVCQVFKTLYAFVVFANLAHLAQLVLDVRARHRQIRRGKYDKMHDSQDIKIDDLKPLAPNTVHEQPMASEISLQQSFRDEQPSHHQQPDYRDESPGWRPGQRQTTPQPQAYTSSNSSVYSRSRDDHYYSHDNGSSMYMQDFSYQRPQPATRHDSDHFHSGYGYQQNQYYQSRY